jgi:hypothetical protein
MADLSDPVATLSRSEVVLCASWVRTELSKTEETARNASRSSEKLKHEGAARLLHSMLQRLEARAAELKIEL